MSFVNFDVVANNYDQTRKSSNKILSVLMDKIIEFSKPVKVNNILEIGCGTGRVSKIFGTSDFHITGVDVSKKMLKIAINKAEKEKWNFKGVLANATELPLGNNSFEVVYFVNVLHLIEDWKKAILEAIRVSKDPSIICNIGLSQKVEDETIWDHYHSKIEEIKQNRKLDFKHPNDSYLGVNPYSNELIQFFNENNYGFRQFETKNVVTWKKEEIINLVKLKTISSLRYIPESVHQEAINYLEQHNYFFGNDVEKEVSVVEKLKIQCFIKNQKKNSK